MYKFCQSINDSIMKNSVKLIVTVAFLFSLALFSFTSVKVVSDDWNIPEKYKNMKNPTEASKENLAIAQGLWRKHCASCHGKEGLGDGPKAAELDGDPGDFTDSHFQSHTDGELFYMTTFGKDDMPSYEKKIPNDDDRWILVHYMRSLAE